MKLFLSCSSLQGKISLNNVLERKDNMRLGMTLASDPKDNSFVVRENKPNHQDV